MDGINARVRNVVKDAIMNSDDDGGADNRPGIVILGNNNVVGDGNVVIDHADAGGLSERQRYLIERLPNLDEELVNELCRVAAKATAQ